MLCGIWTATTGSIMTSANTVRMLAERAAALGIAVAQPVGLKVAAVGERDGGGGAQAPGYDVALIPESYIAESLVESLRGKVEGKRVLVARAAVARDVIPDALRAAGAEVDVVEAYRNGTPEGAAEQLRRAVEAGLDAATFTSCSSVTHLAEAARAAGMAWPLAGIAGDFDWADYQRDAARGGLGAGGRGRVL